jgi:hypothetical protein
MDDGTNDYQVAGGPDWLPKQLIAFILVSQILMHVFYLKAQK